MIFNMTDTSGGGGGGSAVTVIDETLPNGSTARHITGVNISDTTAVASDVATGKVFYDADGTKTTGSASSVTVESLSVTTNGTYTAPTGKAYSPVTVNVSGGGGGEAEEKDVNFYDYDGTRVYSYTKADFLALNAMPANPDHSGDDIPLTSQGWNWSLADAKTYVTSFTKLNIGQTYTPTDEKTHIVIEIPQGVPSAQLTYYVRCTPTVATGVTIDWDDGNTTTTSSTSATNYSHTYAAPGTYDITVKATSGTVSFVGASTNAIYGATANYWNRLRIRSVRFGKNVTVGNYAFYYCYNLQDVTVPSTVTLSGTNVFQYCYALRHITIPSGVTSITNYLFANCNTLETVSIPASVTSIGNYGFDSCYELRSAQTPSNLTSLGEAAFNYNYKREEILVPSGVTSISARAFANIYGVLSIHVLRYLPNDATPITALANTNAFSSVPSNINIVVPDAAVSSYKAASYWSTYASRIIGESDV